MKLGDGEPVGARALPRAAPAFEGWQGRLELDIALDELGRSRMRRARHEGPLRVQRSFHPEGAAGPCHVYVLHPPGGVVDGDSLTVTARVAERAALLLTTPGATKLYRARVASSAASSVAHTGRGASVVQQFEVADGAQLEWLPHETIAFSGAEARLRTSIALHAQATYTGWELICLGRPAASEQFTAGELSTELSVSRAGRLSYFERGRYLAGDRLLTARWGLGGFPVFGTMVVASPKADTSWVEQLRAEVAPPESDALFAATLVSGVLIARYLGPSTREGRLLFERSLTVLRPLYAERAAVFPRIWST